MQRMNANAKSKRNAVVNMRVPLRVRRAVQRAAVDDHGRSMSGMVVRILEEWLEARNYLKPAPHPGAYEKDEG